MRAVIALTLVVLVALLALPGIAGADDPPPTPALPPWYPHADVTPVALPPDQTHGGAVDPKGPAPTPTATRMPLTGCQIPACWPTPETMPPPPTLDLDGSTPVLSHPTATPTPDGELTWPNSTATPVEKAASARNATTLTRPAGKKGADTVKRKYGPEHFAAMGRKGKASQMRAKE